MNSRLEDAYCNIASLLDLSEGISARIDHTIAELATKNDIDYVDNKLMDISRDQSKALRFVDSSAKDIKILLEAAKNSEAKSSFLYNLGLEVAKITVLSLFIIFLLRVGVADLIIKVLSGT